MLGFDQPPHPELLFGRRVRGCSACTSAFHIYLPETPKGRI